MKQKFFADHSSAGEKLFADVGANNIKVYSIPDYNRLAQVPVHSEKATAKYSQVTVITSGDAGAGINWMAVVGHRVDESPGGEKVQDIDPVLIALGPNGESAHVSGVVAYHQDFTDRTKPITGYNLHSVQATVTDLRNRLVVDEKPLAEALPEVSASLQHMVGKFRESLAPASDGSARIRD